MMLDSLTMDARGAWSIELDSGQEIQLGRRNVEERLDRLFKVAVPLLTPEFERVTRVDLRYTNGFAVGWLEEPDLQLADTNEALESW